MTTHLYVAPNGNDASSGSLPAPDARGADGPLVSLARAVSVARNVSEPPVHIILRGGTYYDVHIELDERDSGLVIEAAEGETPMLVGGHPITGWRSTPRPVSCRARTAKQPARGISRSVSIAGPPS